MKTLHSIIPSYADLVFIGLGHPCPECNLGHILGGHHTCARHLLNLNNGNGAQYCECDACYDANPELRHYGATGQVMISDEPDWTPVCVYCLADNHPVAP